LLPLPAKQADIVVERALVALERQNVIGSLVPYLFGNTALATHRINREDVPCDISLVHYHKSVAAKHAISAL
jgi:hypothetical protein